MPTELIVHIGDPKTGSSSIQTILGAGRWRGRGGTIAYPVRRLSHGSLADIVNEGGDAYLEHPEVGMLRAAYERQEADHLVISAEQFWLSDPERVEEVIETILPGAMSDARLIAYVRPHADRLLSSWQQRVKMGLITQDFDRFSRRMIKKGSFAYADRMQRWSDRFGARFTVRPFVRAVLYRQDVVDDFLRFVLGSEDFEVTGDTGRNSSLRLEQLAMLRELRLALKRRRVDRGASIVAQYFGRQLVSLPLISSKKTKLSLSVEQVSLLTDAYGEDAWRMDAAYFEGTPMTDALEKAAAGAVPERQTIVAEKVLGPRELRLLRVWVELAARMAAFVPKGIASRVDRMQRAR